MTNVLSTYFRLPIEIEKAEGYYLFDIKGNKYLDFASGIAVTNLGHKNGYINKIAKDQIDKLWHCSNIFTIREQERLASRLTKLTGTDKAFFCSSGLEANECAIKLIRKYKSIKTPEIIVLKNGFHGRSIATLSMNENQYAKDGFGPFVDGFIKVEANNIEDFIHNINNNTVAVIVELIQSEGGIFPLKKEYLNEVRRITEENNIILAFDEVQTGYGRCGYLFAFEKYEIYPDVITIAKGMGNGFPIAACLVKENIAKSISPGMHGSTYGGNPLAMAIGNSVLDIVNDATLLKNVKKASDFLHSKLIELKSRFPSIIKEVRGEGLLVGLELHSIISNIDFLKICYKKRLAVTKANNNVIRLLPPITITSKEIVEAVKKLELSCRVFLKSGNK